MQIIFLSGTKCLWLAQKIWTCSKHFETCNVNEFLVSHKKFEPAQNILRPVKGQDICGTQLSILRNLHFVGAWNPWFFTVIRDFFHLHSTNLNFCNLATLRVKKLSGTYFDFKIWQILTNSKEQFQHKSQNMEDSLFWDPKTSISILYQKRYGWKKQKNLNLFTFLYKFQNYQPWQMLFLVCTLHKISWKMTQKSQTVAHIYDLILETRIL